MICSPLRRSAAAVLAALVLAAGVAGCTGSSSPPRPASSSASRPASSAGSGASVTPAPGGGVPPAASASGTPAGAPGAHPTTMAGYYAQRLSWAPCDSGLRCARLWVPFDYARPAGAAFSLPVVELPAATPAERVGALVVNPGGPGASGVQYARDAASGEVSASVRDRFDIVGFDPRGVGGSQPALRCMSGPQADQYLAVNTEPATPAQLAAVESASKAVAADCEANGGALLPYLGTASSARDMDILRAALGEARLTFLGKSYGTVLGASYAQQFPGRVRALVLDGAVAPHLSGIDEDIAQASGFQAAFGQFTAWCARQAGCPVPAAEAAASAKVAALVSAANARPLVNLAGPAQPADGAMLLLGVASALYSQSSWPFLKDGLTQAEDGDGTLLVSLADELEERNPDGTYSNLLDVGTAVSCIDRAWPRAISAWQQAAAAAAKAAPLFGPSLVWGSLPCAYWPVAPTPALAGNATAAPPVLVVGDLHDPATPYAWAQSLAGWLHPGVLLGWNGQGHTSYAEGSSCIDGAVDDYLISLHVPASGTVCP